MPPGLPQSFLDPRVLAQLQAQAAAQRPMPQQQPRPQQSNGIISILDKLVNDSMRAWGLTGQDPVITPDTPAILGGVQKLLAAPGRALFNAQDSAERMTGEVVNMALDTENKRKARAAAAVAQQAFASPSSNVMPQSYKDPAWDQYEADAAKATGVPVELLRSIRLAGEKSNSDQVSSAGAKLVYQFIPETAASLKSKYGIDVFASPAQAALGAATLLKEGAGPNQDWGTAINRYHGGYDPSRWGPINAAYKGRVMDMFVGGYDPSADQQAMAFLNQGERAAMTPWNVSANSGPAPEMPKLEPIPQTDFAAADAALEAMRPIEMSEKQKIANERTGFWKGLAQGLAASPEGVGLGKLFAMMGGGALAGRMAAREENVARQEKFDDKLAQYNAAIYSHELGKAKVIGQELQAQVAQNNDWAMKKYAVSRTDWGNRNKVDIQGNTVVISSMDPKTGQMNVRGAPIPGAVASAFALQKANLMQAVGGRMMAGQQSAVANTNAIIAGVASREMLGGDQQTSDAAAAAVPAFYATHIVKAGRLVDLLGPEEAEKVVKEVDTALGAQRVMIGSPDYAEKREFMLAERLAAIGMASPEILKRMSQIGAAADLFEAADRVHGARETTRTDAKGRTTRSSSSTYDYRDQ